MPDEIDAVADELYGLRPDEFVAGRDAAVVRARDAGDRELARAIGRLRRPTRAAWLSNLLARHRAEQLDGLLGLAAGLADAQRTLDGETLRALSAQRSRLVAAMAQEAGQLARAGHEPVTESLLRELQRILEAALADPEVAAEVRGGRLARSITYSGFGPADTGSAAAPPRPPGPVTRAADSDVAERAQAERERDRAERERMQLLRNLAAAVASADAARERQEATAAGHGDATEAHATARTRVAELTSELDRARERERTAADAVRAAAASAKAAARELAAAQTRVARAQAATGAG